MLSDTDDFEDHVLSRLFAISVSRTGLVMVVSLCDCLLWCVGVVALSCLPRFFSTQHCVREL